MKEQKGVLLSFWMLGCLCWAFVYFFAGCARTPLNKNSGISSKEALNPQSMLVYLKYVQENQKILIRYILSSIVITSTWLIQIPVQHVFKI